MRRPLATALLSGVVIGASGASPPPITSSAAPPRIVIVEPRATGGVVGAAELSPLVSRFKAKLREVYPCARIWSMDDVRQYLKDDKAAQLFGTGNPEAMRILGEKLDADLIIALSFRTSGTTHDSPRRHATMSAIDPRTVATIDRGAATADGWDWTRQDVVDELVEGLGGRFDLCPWLGTVVYEKRYKKDSAWTQGPVAEGDGTRTERFKSTVQLEEKWTLTLDRRGIAPPRLRTSGASVSTSSEVLAVESKNISCFPEVDGRVDDSRRVFGVSSTVTTTTTSRSEAADSLTEAKLTITPGEPAEVPTWDVAIGGIAGGTSSGSAIEEKRGGCGNWKRPIGGEAKGASGLGGAVDGALAALQGLPSYASPVSAALTDLRAERGTLQGTRTYRDEDGASITITWNLRRQ
jgi:hypothetical protein